MNWRTWMAAGLVALAAGAAPVLAQGTQRAPAKPLAVVNGVAISADEVEALLKTAGPTSVHLSQNQERMRRMEALGVLIDNVLWRQYLAKNTPAVAPAEVARRLEEMRIGLQAQNKTIEEFCHDTNQTAEQLKANIADHLRWMAFVRQQVTDPVVEQYYRDNKDFFDQVKVQASHIVLRLAPNATDKDRAEARGKLEQVRKQLVSDPKADFAEMARKHSQDPAAARGGDLGEFPRKWFFDEPFSQAAFALKPGEISQVVQTDYGLHLIKVTRRIPGKPSDFSKIKEGVRDFCAEDLRQQILARERKSAVIDTHPH
jgi:peptidyl-prolyl cis-trans isomerase C